MKISLLSEDSIRLEPAGMLTIEAPDEHAEYSPFHPDRFHHDEYRLAVAP